MTDKPEFIVAERQPTYEPGEPGTIVTPIPVMVRKPVEARTPPEENKQP